MSRPVWPGYFADPFVLRLPGGDYVAYGSGSPAGEAGASGRVFECLTSPDLRTWTSRGMVLTRLPAGCGDEYWAPEVAFRDGSWWLYYSVGHGIRGHHLRVARADGPLGPFEDTGTNLTPAESFAIDAHPFQDHDGAWYLFFARDVLDHPRPGTHLAVAQMPEPTRLGPTVPALQPNADWQLYQRSRTMYGREFDWHTLEGPAVVHRLSAYWMTFSGGAWTGPDYAVSWARAAHPLGPWEHAPAGSPRLLATDDVLTGPGHNSLTTTPAGADAIAYHAWDAGRTRRQFRIDALHWTPAGPSIAQPG